MEDINLGILKRPNSLRLKKKYSVVVEDSPYSFEVNSFNCSFGFGRLGRMTLKELEIKYEDNRIPGLYAIVMPAGGGKSTAAKTFNQLDVDCILPPGTELGLKHLRLDTHYSVEQGLSRSAWVRHNTLWSRHLEMALDKYDFQTYPRVVFFHSPEIAVVLGAKLIGILSPTEMLHDEWIESREREGKILSKENREWLIRNVSQDERWFEYRTGLELNKQIAYLIGANLGYSPGIGDFLPLAEIDALMVRDGFDITVPQDIKRGKLAFEDIDAIVEWCKQGRLPWWMISSWCAQFSPGLIADGAYMMDAYPWFRLGYEITHLLRGPAVPGQIVRAMIKSNLDWFGMFPHADALTQGRAGVSLRSLFKHMRGEDIDDYVITILNMHVGSHHSFVVSLVAYYLGIVKHFRKELRDLVIHSGILLVPEDRWVSIHTEIHKLVRASQMFFGMELTNREYASLQYTSSLYGRRNYRLDPQAEILKRQEPRLCGKKSVNSHGYNHEDYIDDFKEGVRLAYARLGSKGRLRWQNFAGFFKCRYQWAAGGSVTNVPPGMEELREVSDVVVEVQEMIKHLSMDSNKKRAMEKLMGPAQMARYLSDNWAYNVTSLAPKPNEPAKERVLMPGSFLHYVAMSYILGMVERTGDVGAVRVGDPEDNNLSHFDLRLATGTYNFMLDFADHNAQHSSVEMGLIISLLGEKFRAKVDADDLDFFINWVVDSFYNMKVKVGPTTHDVVSGLFTGWRGTTWINSVACQAYVYVGVKACIRRHGAIECEYFEGAGDDVLMKFKSAKDAFRFYDMMKQSGFDMQSIKQMASHRKTEFLRTISSDGHLACCINRVLPNFVSGDLERQSEGMLDRLGGCYATIKMLERRGLDTTVSRAMYCSYLDKWARVKINDSYVDVSRKYIHADTIQGGLGLPDEMDNIWLLSRPIIVNKVKPRLIKGPDYASRDYARVMAEELQTKNLRLDEARYSERLTEDVYGISASVNESDLIDLDQEVIAVYNPVEKVEPELLAKILRSCDDELVKKFKSQWSTYSKFKQTFAYIEDSDEAILAALKISIDVNQLENLRFPSNHCFLIPEYLLYNIGIYFRSRVAFGLVSRARAEYDFTVACSTARRMFQSDILL